MHRRHRCGLSAVGLTPACFLLAWCADAWAQSTPSPTPALRAIEEARKAIGQSPDRAEPYNRLAMALARRARETADTEKYKEAEEALARSLEIEPENFEGLKARAWVLLGRHEFAEALELAKRLNKRMADDAIVYGFLTDAHIELGNYKEAEEAAQWMLDLGRANVAGRTRAAYLRELFGDIDGAVEMMVSAYERIHPSETEDRAWVLTQIAHLHLMTGKLEAAGQALEQALQLFPGYHYALANQAKLRSAEGRHAEAAELLRRHYQSAPHPENLFDLAVALKKAGRVREAQRAFAEFEGKAREEMNSWDNANLQLIFYYTDHAKKPAEALRVAALEAGRRRDVYTRDAYAWALGANGRYAEGRRQMEAALAVGVRDPKLLYHAGVLCLRQGDRAAARRYLQLSLEVNSQSEVAGEARRALRRLP